MADRIDIGIDGGGTGCRVVVASKGREVHAQGGPANVVTDPAAAEAALRGALLEALRAFGLGLDDLAPARVVAGLAGCRLPGMADDFAMRLPFLAYVVDDSVTALEGAFGGGAGTLVNLGTGSFFIRRDARGITHQGGWGLHLGDEGSAAWLGRRALQDWVRVADGRLPDYAEDPLLLALETACATHPVRFASRSGPDAFAALTPLIVDGASPWADALRAEVIKVVHLGLQDLAHPPGGAWVLTGGLGRALAGAQDLPVGMTTARGGALDGALAMARALP